MERLPVTNAVRLELNANDLSVLHSGLVELVDSFHTRPASGPVPADLFDLFRRLETAMAATDDVPRAMLQDAITTRATLETENLARMKGEGDSTAPGKAKT